MSNNLEYCFKCDEATGCAGRADDSHYNEDGEGPFCWRCWCEDQYPRQEAELDTTNKRTKHIKGGAENNIYNLLNAITDNKYGPYSVSHKDDVVPQWFDALAKETKVLIAELATAKKRITELEAEKPKKVQGFRRGD